jgi:hypothetical protein
MTASHDPRPTGDLASKRAFALSHISIRKNPGDWRWTNRISGEINGLPMSRGVLVATNGILCLIEQGETYFEGHLQWFVADEDEGQDEVNGLRKDRQPKESKRDAVFAALMEDFEL